MKKNKDNKFEKKIKEEINYQEKQQKKHVINNRISKIKKAFSGTKYINIKNRKVTPILVPFFIVMIFLIIIPLISILIYVFVKPTNGISMFKISLSNILRFMKDSGTFISMILSIMYALIASIFCVVIGYPIALILSNIRSKIFVKNIWLLITLPMWILMLLKVLGLRTLFYLLSPSMLGTSFAIIIGMVYMFLPFAITPIYDVLVSRDRSLEEASKDLGNSNIATFFAITLKLSMSGVITAFTIVIVQAATSLIVVAYLGDGKINLITSIIESYFFKGNDFGYGATISLMLSVFIFIIVWILKIINKKIETKGGIKHEKTI